MDLATGTEFAASRGSDGSHVGSKIASFERNENGTLALTFSMGSAVTLADSSKEFEPYDITRPGETIIVKALLPITSLIRTNAPFRTGCAEHGESVDGERKGVVNSRPTHRGQTWA